ncbi:hypothetical protein BABINDRAFT_21289, partial [Babjeviella inositovora NRRL Y-12698]
KQQEGKEQRKRNRLPMSCDKCRKRKVKCDRGRPCEVCKKYNMPHLCLYQEPTWNGDETDSQPPVKVIRWDDGTPPYMTAAALPVALIPLVSGQASTASFSQSTSTFKSVDPGARKAVKPAVEPSPTSITSIFSPLEPSPVMDELEKLKDKIKQIEASITVTNMSNQGQQANGNIPVSPANGNATRYGVDNYIYKTPPLTSHGSFQGTYGMPSTFPEPPQKTAGEAGCTPASESTPYAASDHIDFYAGYSSMHVTEARLINHGPLSYLSVMKKDPFLSYLWNLVHECKKRQKVFPYGSPEPSANGHNPDDKFHKTLLRDTGLIELQPYSKMGLKLQVGEVVPTSATPKNEDLELLLVETIKKTLPTQRVTWLLVERFFKYLYPFFPIVDEWYFSTTCFENILGEIKLVDEPFLSVNVLRTLDFANLGSMFVILRFSYLSLLSNNDDNASDDPDINYLLAHPIEANVIKVAQMCLNQFPVLRKSSLFIFRCTYLLRLYYIYAPEECDGADGGDSQVFTGMLAQMANGIGLNRDPSSFDQLSDDPRLMNIWRKFWHQIVTFDVHKGTMLGSPLNIKLEYSDTRVPTLDDHNQNIKDLALEKLVLENIHQNTHLNGVVTELLELILNMKSAPKIAAITSLTDQLEAYVRNKFVDLRTILTPYNGNHLDSVRKVYHTITYLFVNSFLIPVYYHLFLFYEQARSLPLCYTYFAKMVLISNEILSTCLSLLVDCPKYFGKGFDFILTPQLEFTCHRAFQIQLSGIIRGQCALSFFREQLPTTPAETANIQRNIDILECLVLHLLHLKERHIQAFLKISDKYYYAWRMNKAHKFVLLVLK